MLIKGCVVPIVSLICLISTTVAVSRNHWTTDELQHCTAEMETNSASRLIAGLYKQISVTKQQLAVASETCTACFSQPCQNNGTCVANGTSYLCQCPQDTTGANCEQKLVCTSTSCAVNAHCAVAHHQINCACNLGYSGNPYPDQQNGVSSTESTTSESWWWPTTDYYGSQQGAGCWLHLKSACANYDPTYSTFDGTYYVYDGTCPYVFSAPCDESATTLSDAHHTYPAYKVITKNSILFGLDTNNIASAASMMTFLTYGVNVTIDEQVNILIDGVKQNSPYYWPSSQNYKIYVYTSGNYYAYIFTDYYLTLSLTPGRSICLEVPNVEAFRGPNTLCGLAGNIDDSCWDDMRLRNGSLWMVPNQCYPTQQQAAPFGDDWIVQGSKYSGCVLGQDIIPDPNSTCPPSVLSAAQLECRPVNDASSGQGQFASCSVLNQAINVNYLTFLFQDCIVDYCADPVHEVACETFALMFSQCQQAGGVHGFNDWRTVLNCPFRRCPAFSHYEQCAVCPYTCSNYAQSGTNCTQSCREDCVCDDGYVLDTFSGQCVPVPDCGCVDASGNYHGPDSHWYNDNCTAFSNCTNGTLTVQPNACDTHASCVVDYMAKHCACNIGFSGDGLSCQDIDECLDNSTCHQQDGHGTCTNTIGSYICHCYPSYTGHNCETYFPKRHCADLLVLHNETNSGEYTIYPSFSYNGYPPYTSLTVSCDMTTDGGGWTLFTGALGNSTVNKTWAQYEQGFGNITEQDFWLGLSFLSGETAEFNTTLQVELQLCDGSVKNRSYNHFRVFDATTNYTLFLGDGGSGSVGDALTTPFWTAGVGPAFSAVDRSYAADKNGEPCSWQNGRVGWWFDGKAMGTCGLSNLNGVRFGCDYLTTHQSNPSPSALEWSSPDMYWLPRPTAATIKLRPTAFPHYDSHM